MASPTKNPIMKVTDDVKNAQATEGTRGSDMVAEDMIEVHTAHATSTTGFSKSRITMRYKKRATEPRAGDTANSDAAFRFFFFVFPVSRFHFPVSFCPDNQTTDGPWGNGK